MNKENIGYMPQAKTVEWGTPQELFDRLNEEFNFTLDPCATKDNAKCEKYFTIKENGLIQSWKDEIVFMNCPYGREMKFWMEKAFKETNKIDGAKIVVGLLKATTDTIPFHKFIYKKNTEIRFIKGRVKYIDGNKPQPAPFPSMIVIWKNINTQSL